jgi:WD40 repeat protein
VGEYLPLCASCAVRLPAVEDLVAGRLTEDDLKDLGVKRMKPRKAVMQALRRLAPKRRVTHSTEVDARVREWDDGHGPQPPRRGRAPGAGRRSGRSAAKPKGTPLEQAEAELRQAVRRADPYQSPWMTLTAVMKEADAGLMAGEPPSGTVSVEWFTTLLETKLQLGAEKVGLLLEKYGEGSAEGEGDGEADAGEQLMYQQFAKALFAKGGGSSVGGSGASTRPGRRLVAQSSQSRRPSSAPARGRSSGSSAYYPPTRESALFSGGSRDTQPQPPGDALLREHAAHQRAMVNRQRALTERSKRGVNPTPLRRVDPSKIRRRRASRDEEAQQSMELERQAIKESLDKASALRERALRKKSSHSGDHVRKVRKSNDEYKKAKQIVRQSHSDYRRSVHAWSSWAEEEAAAMCTFAPAVSGKVRYSHISPRGKMHVRTSIAERTQAAQREKVNLLEERRSAEVAKKSKMTQIMGKQIVDAKRPPPAATPLRHAFRRGAFRSDEPQDWLFEGVIKYRHCRQAITVPTFWPEIAQRACKRSSEKPDVWLQLEHVFGYNGPKNIQPNVFFTKSKEVLYYTSAVGILYDAEANTQRFYIGHEDEISCMALHPDLDTVATGGTGAVPKIQFWSASTMKAPEAVEQEDPSNPKKHELPLMAGDQYVLCMAFSPDGKLLLTVSANEDHTIRIWDWVTKKMIENGETKGNKGEAPQVYGAVWNPYRKGELAEMHHFDFVTFGKRHLTFWVFEPGGEPVLAKKDASYGDVGERQSIHHCVFLPSGQMLSGGDNGKIMVWEKNKALREIDAHAKGPLKCLRLKSDDKTLVTSGGDAYVNTFEISFPIDPELESQLQGLNDAIKTQPVEITKRQMELVKNVVRVLDQAIKDEGRQLFTKLFSNQQELFDCMDRNASGSLSEQEFQDSTERLGLGLKDDQVKLLWSVMDGEGSGELEFGEFAKLFQLEAILLKLINSAEIEITKVEDQCRDLDPGRDGPQTVTCIDVHPELDYVVAADTENDIWKVDDQPDVMVEGQSGLVFGLSPHPTFSRMYATACADGYVGIWNAEHRMNVKMVKVERGKPTREQRKLGYIGWDDGDKDAEAKHEAKGEDRDHLQAWAVCFSDDGTMMAVSTNGIVGDENREHADLGGCLIVYKCEDAMFEMSDDPALKEFPAKKLFEVKDMSTRIDDLKFSPDSQYLAAGSHDRVIDIYRYVGESEDPCFVHNGRCKGHSATVIALDWSVDSQLLRSCSVDNELMHWNSAGKLVLEETQDKDWATWTTKVGFPVMGIWAKGMSSSEISHVYRSNNQKWVVAADHNGLVRLNNYPAVTQHTPCFAHRGHASHVTRVAFLSDDSRVISCGGADMATYQWSA